MPGCLKQLPCQSVLGALHLWSLLITFCAMYPFILVLWCLTWAFKLYWGSSWMGLHLFAHPSGLGLSGLQLIIPGGSHHLAVYWYFNVFMEGSQLLQPLGVDHVRTRGFPALYSWDFFSVKLLLLLLREEKLLKSFIHFASVLWCLFFQYDLPVIVPSPGLAGQL